MGVYGTQTALTVPTLDDKVVLSDNGITKASTLQQVLDVLEAGIDLADLPFTPAGSIAATDVQGAIEELDAALTDHLGDTADAHDASAVSVLDTENDFTGTDVEAVLHELFDAVAGAGNVDSVNGETGVVVLDAGDIGVTPFETIAATDVQAALEEIFAEAAGTPTTTEPATTLSSVTGSQNLDVQAAGAYVATMVGNSTFVFTNPPAADELRSFLLLLNGAYTPTWPGSVTWLGGEPEYDSNLTTYVFTTTDGGTTWYGAAVGATPVYELETIMVAVTDEISTITTTGTKLTFRMPFAMQVTDVRASLKTACASGTFTVDINEGGTSILSTKLTIDATEKTSTTAATPRVFSDTNLADDAEITIDVDNTGNSLGVGLKVAILGHRV